jgi:hypothetical protein
MRKYEFGSLREPSPGIGLARYWNWNIRSYGRELFREAVQSHWSELPQDPWGKPGDDDDGLPPEESWSFGPGE